MKWRLRGVVEMKRKIQGKAIKYPRRVTQSVQEEAEAVLERSTELVPVDEGDLAVSGRVEIVRNTKRQTVAQIAYGGVGETDEYAVIQHEDTTLNHPNGGEAKFLEKALKEVVRIQKFARKLRIDQD